jgi:hypothetical protein
VALELFEELDYLGPFDAAGVDLEVKAQPHQPADDRKTLPIEGLLQQGCLPSQSPGPDPRRPCAQTALINKDYQPVLAARFFLAPATALVSTGGWSSRRVLSPGVPDAGN